MSWRRQPPVLSPVPVRGLVDGVEAALGLRENAHEHVRSALKLRYGCLDVLLTDSGTSALILALRKLARRGGAVAYPAYGCTDLTTAAVGAGVRVRLYDVDPNTLSPDLDSVRAAIRRGVDAIVVAHLYGYPADVVGIRSIAAEHGIPMIEDAAQGGGASLGGALLGSIGDVAILSFGRGKGTTGGSGGALLLRTPELAEWASGERARLQVPKRGVREMAILAAQALLSHPSLYRVPSSLPGLRLGETVYHPPRLPGTMSPACAAVLRWTLADEVQRLCDRRARANDLRARMPVGGGVTPVRCIPGAKAGFLRFALVDVKGALPSCADLGALRGYPMTLAEHTQLTPMLLHGEIAGKGSEYLRDRLFTVPTHFRVEQQDLKKLARWVGQRETEPFAFVPAA